MGRGLMERHERRMHRRDVPAQGLAQAGVRLRTGSPLRVLDTSVDGMLVESPARLLPGRQVDLVLQSGSTQEQSPWIVVHSRVGCIRGSSYLRYRAGLRRATGSSYPRQTQAPGSGNELPAPNGLRQSDLSANAEESNQSAVGIRFGRQRTI
jgi:hypothetical protein